MIDDDKFVHSGDLGKLDEVTGALIITGRKKDLIITAGGENVAPLPIEERFLELCPFARNIVITGDGKKYLTALITLKQKTKTDAEHPTIELQTQQFLKDEIGSQAVKVEDAINDVKIQIFV